MLARFRNRYFLILDLIFLALTPVIALALRVNLPWNPDFNLGLIYYTLYSLSIKLLVFYYFGFYRRLWRYASVDAIISIIWGVGFASAIITGTVALVLGFDLIEGFTIPRSLPIIDAMLTLIYVAGTRLSLRMVQYQSGRSQAKENGTRVLIVGAGDAGQMVAREILTSRHIRDNLVGFVDDDPFKIGSLLHNAPVLGPLDQIPDVIDKQQVDEVIIAMPTAPGEVIRKVVELSESRSITPKTLPGIFELITGDVTVNQLRDVEVGDLMRRKPVFIGLDRVKELLADKRVLVTGAGGSIGSELCNQILACSPAALFALGHGENSLFDLPSRIRDRSASQREKLKLVVADIRDRERIENLFSEMKPEIVFHAAAHKHVPLMEQNLADAITNNILGTRTILELCAAHDVDRFVYISTDKAVEPMNIMGRTKKVGEMMVECTARMVGKPYVSVRFGNVLGSRGSVVPLFKEQIAAGGPVTVTDPDVERFFMTIPEAVQLVLQASSLGKKNEVFVLDMGEQIKIKDLAVELISLSGLEVGRDIEIVYTGLRPGERISERLFARDETPQETVHDKIKSVVYSHKYQDSELWEKVELLVDQVREGDSQQAWQLLCDLTEN